MRKYIFVNLGLDPNMFELTFLLKRAQINSLSIFV